jgi:hypothetical protein
MKAFLRGSLAVLAGLAVFYWVFWSLMRLSGPMSFPIAAAIGRQGDEASVLLFGIVFFPCIGSLVAGITTACIAKDYPFVYSILVALILLLRGALYIHSAHSNGYTIGMLLLSTVLSLPVLALGTWLGVRIQRPRRRIPRHGF